MRARSINEIQNFERGQNPKKSMDLGGIELNDKHEEFSDELRMDIQMTLNSYDEEWNEFLRKSFVGKTITAIMTKMPKINNNGGMEGRQIKGEYTITVQDIRSSDDFHKTTDLPMSGSKPYPATMIVADMDNNLYTMGKNQKIFFK